jgi:hypothetical protein
VQVQIQEKKEVELLLHNHREKIMDNDLKTNLALGKPMAIKYLKLLRMRMKDKKYIHLRYK